MLSVDSTAITTLVGSIGGYMPRGRIWLWVEIICSECSVHIVGQSVQGSYIPKAKLTNEALGKGAIIVGDNIYCIMCRKRKGLNHN